MRRPALILAFAALAALALAAGTGWFVKSVCCRRAEKADPLDWLRTEFHLNADQLARIRQLHDGYLPTCESHCDRIARLNASLKVVLEDREKGAASPEVSELLKQIGVARAECQAAMLRHFVEVSRAMEPEQGRRYLAEMQRLTIFSHGNIEASMSSEHPGDHGH